MRTVARPTRTMRHPSLLGARLVTEMVSVDGGVTAGVPTAPSTPPLGGCEPSAGSSLPEGFSLADSLGDSLADSLGDSLADSLGDSLADSLGDSLADSLGDSLADSLGDSLADSLGCSLADSLGCSLADSLGCSLADSLGCSLGDSLGCSFGPAQMCDRFRRAPTALVEAPSRVSWPVMTAKWSTLPEFLYESVVTAPAVVKLALNVAVVASVWTRTKCQRTWPVSRSASLQSSLEPWKSTLFQAIGGSW
jgi:hypothetical protein